MFGQTQVKDINLFCEIANVTYEDKEEITNTVLIPAFIISELRQAFIIGFIIYIPFIVIDMDGIIRIDVHGYDDASTDNHFLSL